MEISVGLTVLLGSSRSKMAWMRPMAGRAMAWPIPQRSHPIACMASVACNPNADAAIIASSGTLRAAPMGLELRADRRVAARCSLRLMKQTTVNAASPHSAGRMVSVGPTSSCVATGKMRQVAMKLHCMAKATVASIEFELMLFVPPSGVGLLSFLLS